MESKIEKDHENSDHETEQGKQPEKYRYDYFVNKNPKPEEKWIDPTPTPIANSAPPVTESGKKLNASQWNSSGTWEERSLSMEDFVTHIHKHKRQLTRLVGLQWTLVQRG